MRALWFLKEGFEVEIFLFLAAGHSGLRRAVGPALRELQGWYYTKFQTKVNKKTTKKVVFAVSQLTSEEITINCHT